MSGFDEGSGEVRFLLKLMYIHIIPAETKMQPTDMFRIKI